MEHGCIKMWGGFVFFSDCLAVWSLIVDEELKKELQKRAIAYLDMLEKGIKEGGDFLIEKAPETVQQWITYNLWFYGVVTTLCVIGLIICLILIGVCVKKWNKLDRANAEPIITLPIIVGVGCGIASIVNGLQCLKIYIAPNVFILEEISKLIKG